VFVVPFSLALEFVFILELKAVG